jgi:hypothetical protein
MINDTASIDIGECFKRQPLTFFFLGDPGQNCGEEG